MEHTIKIDAGKSIVSNPDKAGGGVTFDLKFFGASMASGVLTPDQCGVLIFALEHAMAKPANGLRCLGDACAAGQLPCPTPTACGCAA